VIEGSAVTRGVSGATVDAGAAAGRWAAGALDTGSEGVA